MVKAGLVAIVRHARKLEETFVPLLLRFCKHFFTLHASLALLLLLLALGSVPAPGCAAEEFAVCFLSRSGHLRKSFPRAVGRMEVDFRCPDSDINVVYLSSYLGKGEASGHRCDGTCQIEHVWANLYCCKSMNVTHVCDSNCDQRVLHDRHTTLCKVSGKFFPLTIIEQQAIAGVRRKRDSECGDSYMYKRRREVFRNPAPTLMAPFQRAFPVSDRVGFGEGFMDLQ